MTRSDDKSNVPATTDTAKFDLDHTRRLQQVELENQQLRRELQDAYLRIQQLEAKVLAVENGFSSLGSTASFCSVTSSVTTAIAGSPQAVQGRRRDQQRCDFETRSTGSDHEKNQQAIWQMPVLLSSRTASDLTLASQHQSSSMIPQLLPSSSNSASSIESSSMWSSEEDTRTGWRENDLHRIAMRYLERIDSTDSQ
jgi:hypothetical protein